MQNLEKGFNRSQSTLCSVRGQQTEEEVKSISFTLTHMHKSFLKTSEADIKEELQNSAQQPHRYEQTPAHEKILPVRRTVYIFFAELCFQTSQLYLQELLCY